MGRSCASPSPWRGGVAAPATVSRNPLLEKSAGLSTGSRRARRRRAAARLRSATVHGSYPFPGQDAVFPDGRIEALEYSRQDKSASRTKARPASGRGLITTNSLYHKDSKRSSHDATQHKNYLEQVQYILQMIHKRALT